MAELKSKFSEVLLDFIDETFENHHGIYLDKGTNLFETLAAISAEEASIPVGKQCATIAAQVEHVIFYLEIIERSMTGEEIKEIDWEYIWKNVSSVTSEDWTALREKLKAAYTRIKGKPRRIDNWEEGDLMGEAMAIVVHTAYHLGEIRQALCTVKKPG
jgi:uncharacterized damage-inducible protein DinB